MVDVSLSLSSVVIIIVYVPDEIPDPIMNEPATLMDPPRMPHITGLVTSPAVVEVIEVQPVAAALNPDPVMDTTVPGGPS